MTNYVSMVSIMETINTTLSGRVRPAVEDLTDGKKHAEREAVWYGRVLDFSELDGAKGIEVQRQSAVLAKNGIIRVRKSTINGEVKYVLTAKNFEGAGLRSEVSVGVTQDMHEVFMKATGQSMDKTRYTFDAGGGLTWEVDIFTDLDGNNKPWCKIDLENPPAELPPLPIKLADVVTPGERTPDQVALVKQLNDVMFQNKVF